MQAVALAGVFAIGGCLPASGPRNTEPRDGYRQRFVAESLSISQDADTIYRRRMLDLLRRSRLVPTDSLARLTVALATVPASARAGVRHAIDCEGAHLRVAHGVAALVRAHRRMKDSLAETGFDPEKTYDRIAAIPERPIPIDPWGCDAATRALP